MGNRILYLVRHGQYHMDEESSEDGALTALGRRQARCIAKRLSEFPIDVIYHSDFERAVETAEIIAEYLPHRPLHSKRCLREGVPSLPKVLLKGDESTKEERNKARARMESAIRVFFASNRRKADRHELLVTHGNLIRYFVRRALHDPVNGWLWLGTHQCGLTMLVIRPPPKRTCLICYNDVGHLKKSMQTPI